MLRPLATDMSIGLLPQRVRSADDGYAREIEARRRRRRRPLQGRGIPGIVRRMRAPAGRTDHIDEKYQEAGHQDDGAQADEHVEAVPGHVGLIGIDAARHALQAQNVHREEGEIEADDDQPERPFTEALAHHPAGHLRKPVIDGAQQRKDRAADQHVVEVSDDEIGIVHLGVEGHRGDHHARQPADHEGKNEADHEQQAAS